MSRLTLFNWAAVVLIGSSLGFHARSAEEPSSPSPAPPGLPVATLNRDLPVDFDKEVLPFLRNNCLACHNQTKAKGGLNLETPRMILHGGDTGPAVVPGKSAESLAFKAAAHLDPELIMPPKDNKANAVDLKPDQLALFKLWIDQGAKGETRAVAEVNWLEHPPTLDPIFAVALTQDGQFAACGRGNRIDVYHVPSGRLATRLTDATLAAAGFTNLAHRDLVNALAFNANGTLLASAGYREVKLWRRPSNVQKFSLPIGDGRQVFALSPGRDRVAVATAEDGIVLYDLATKKPTHTLKGHSASILALGFSADGARLCSSSADKTIRLWNVAEGSLISSTETPSEVRAVCWLDAGRQIAAGNADGTIRLWACQPKVEEVQGAGAKDLSLLVPGAAMVLAKELTGHEGAVNALDSFRDGQQLLSGGADGTIRQWKLEDGKVIRELKHDGAITALAMRPDGQRFASAGTNGLAKLWNAEDGALVATLSGDRYAVERIAETERTLTVAKLTTQFHDKTVQTAEAENKKQADRVAIAISTNTFTEKVFLEKEKAFKEAQTARASVEKALNDLLADIKKVTEAFEAADKAAKESALKAKAATVRATDSLLAAERAALSKSEAERIATDSASVAAKTRTAVGNADTAKETARRIAEESAGVAEKSKAYAAAVAADADIKIKLAAEDKVLAEKAIEEVAARFFTAGQLKPAYDKTVAEAPEKRKQATNQIESTTKTLAGAEKELKNAETRKSVTLHELELATQAAQRASNNVAKVKSTHEGAIAHQQKTETDLDQLKKAAAAPEKPIRGLAFSPDGITVATLGDNRRVHTWSAETGDAFEVFGRLAPAARPGKESKEDPVLSQTGPVSVAFLDGQTLLAADDTHQLIGWDLNPAWQFERAIGTGGNDSPLTDRVNAVRFSPDGQSLATGSGEPTRSGEIKIWNVADGKFLHEFENVHSDAVLSVDFSPDGKYLASSSADRFVRVVDLASGKIGKAFEGHTSYVLGVAWKSDSRTLASAGADNVVKVWDFITGERKKNIDGATKEVTSIAYVGVTDQAVVASGDNQVRLVRDNGEKVRAFEGATDFMNAVAATPDGRMIVAGGQDGILRVWNGHDGKPLANFGAR
jgi:WD40 repeat protein